MLSVVSRSASQSASQPVDQPVSQSVSHPVSSREDREYRDRLLPLKEIQILWLKMKLKHHHHWPFALN